MKETKESIERAKSMFRQSDVGTIGFEFGLYCPFCGFNYNHFSNIYQYDSADGKINVPDPYSLGLRGNVLAIEFYCENAHNWTLVLGFHKGQIFGKLLKDKKDNPV
jgi:hypothetical protein